MQCLPAEQAGLDLGGICCAVLVQQVAEIEGAGCCGRFSFQCPKPFALTGPAAVQVPALPEDVRAELASGKMRDEMSPVRQHTIGIGRQRESALVGNIAFADGGWCYGPGRQCAILLLCPRGARQVEQVGSSRLRELQQVLAAASDEDEGVRVGEDVSVFVKAPPGFWRGLLVGGVSRCWLL